MKHLPYLFLLLFAWEASPTVTVPGDMFQQASFSFTLLPKIIFDNATQTTYVCTNTALPAGSAQATYGVSALLNNYSVFVPLLTSQATVSGGLVPNPLFGQAFSQLALGYIVGSYELRFVPIVVPTATPNIIYAILNIPAITGTPTQLISTAPVQDSVGSADTYVAAMTYIKNGFVAMAVDNGKVFGDGSDNSALTINKFVENVQAIESANNCSPSSSPQALLSYSLSASPVIPYGNTLAALLVGGSTSVTFNAPTPPYTNITLFSDFSLSALYIGTILSSTTGGVSSVTNFNQPIVNFNAVEADSIIATTDRNTIVSAYDLATLHTSINLPYLAVLGGINTTAPTTARARDSVFALPLVNNPLSTGGFAQLASINALPSNVFASYPPHHIYTTLMSDPAADPGDLYTSVDLRAIVGAGSLNSIVGIAPIDSFEIQRIFTHQDAIFAQTIYTGTGAGSSGLFYSQTLFDQNCLVKRWTPWQRKTLTTNYEFTGINPFTGNYYGIPTVTPSSFVQSSWQVDPSLTFFNYSPSALEQTIPLQCGGVQNIQDIPSGNKAVGDTKPSFVMQMGYNTVIIQQTSSNKNANPGIPPGIFTTNDGTLTDFVSPVGTLISFGGALTNAGALVSGDLGYTLDLTSIEDAWFIVGGANGVFICAAADGTGSGSSGITDGFASLQTSQYWQQLGNYTNVKKVFCDSGFLYVLTNTQLDRIALSAANIQQGINCPAKTLALANQFTQQSFASFADILVSGPLALLATSIGLYRVGNGANIQIAQDFASCFWTALTLPESAGPIVCLYPISHNGVRSDISRETVSPLPAINQTTDGQVPTGNVMVLSSAFATHQGRIYRFVCYDTVANGVTNESFQIIPTFFVQNQQSYFWDTKAERTGISMDGASWYLNYVFSTGLLYRGILELLPAYLRSGVPSNTFTFNSVLNAQAFNSVLSPATYISGTGLWSVGNSLGTYTLR